MARWLITLLLLCLCVFSTTDAQPRKKKMKNNKKNMGVTVMDLEKNVSALWDEVNMLSQPVHVHIHGDGHLMDNLHHDHDHFDHDHDYHHHDHDYHHHDHDHFDHDHYYHHHDHDYHHHDHDHKDGEHKMCKHDKDHKHDHKGPKHAHGGRLNKMKEAEGSNSSSGGEAMMGGKGNHSHMHGGMGHSMHDGHGGTHVHIHLHTAMEEEMEMKHHHMPPPPQEYRYARCDMDGHNVEPYVKGAVFFRQMPGEPLEVKVNLKEFTIDEEDESDHKHLRGMHGHEFGDMSDGCVRLGGHYNPHGTQHGGPGIDPSHPADWGNLQLEEDGSVMTSFNDTDASLFGPESLLGRGIVVHAGADDLGQGEDEGSKASGNSGARIACCAIVICPEPAGIWDTES